MTAIIGETIEQLRRALRDYIEAAYHISHPTLVRQRARLLDEEGVVYQRPYLESTPRYVTGKPFQQLNLPHPVLEVFSVVSEESPGREVLIHNPPYHHQMEAVTRTIIHGRSLVVMTGTGSGKTECFLLPILGKLAVEASQSGKEFGNTAAVRAIVLYPMNALVNDQLGRLRLLFGDERIVGKFVEWSGRPARFARYTSRTLYPGVRTEEKDKNRLTPIGKYYIRHLETASSASSSPEEQKKALGLIHALQKRGKWPAKPDLIGWYYGQRRKKGGRWKDSDTDQFVRCVTMPRDPELFTRHEVQDAPPDILVTNYSMLEYMLMRPLERPIFDSTRSWLEKNPKEKILLVIDEAHLYRGAAGAEVALLVRRLRMRLGIPPERLQVICTSASFKDSEYAKRFGAQLTGKMPEDFDSIRGELNFRPAAAKGTKSDADALAGIDLKKFYDAVSDEARLEQVQAFLAYRSVREPWGLERSLYEALESFPPMALLVNSTMDKAQPVASLGDMIFEAIDPDIAARAVTALLALGSLARRKRKEPGLLPCRVHSFYRGLAGLWACMDPQCNQPDSNERGGPTGKLYDQPRDVCECGARVLELFTCRNCGSAYGRAYTDNVFSPSFLWSEPGGAFRTLLAQFDELEPLDLLLENPVVGEDAEPAGYDLITGRLNPKGDPGSRTRTVFLRPNRSTTSDEEDDVNCRPGQFRPCAVCGESAGYGRSPVQDHQTKGDQPFQALITKQLNIQPPGPMSATRLAPLRGKKVLIFSDSRQTAARLAPNLQTYSTQDAMRPLIIAGYLRLQRSVTIRPLLSLESLYLAVLIAAEELGVRLRPALKAGEIWHAQTIVETAVKTGALDRDADLVQLFFRIANEQPPISLLRAIVNCLSDRYYGLESLALASVAERPDHHGRIFALPNITGVATTNEQKLALTRVWLRGWNKTGFWLSKMPLAWWQNEVRSHSGKFSNMKRVLDAKGAKASFERNWLPTLLSLFTEPASEGKFRLKGGELTMQVSGAWAYCQSCRATQRPFPGRATCINCGKDTAVEIDPNSDPVFVARKGYYRASTTDALRDPPSPPFALIAAEHTAQLGSAQAHEVFSKTEEHELLFQDVDLGPGDGRLERPAIDILSSTTTMEVGIDIGTLSGVSLRNMPPARANYQQRAGRAGRRGNAVATVTAFGSADSHDEHYFSNPDEMIRGDVNDPKLTLNNRDIVRRHITAYLLQRYHQIRLPKIRPEDQPHLFAVLGSVTDFRKSDTLLNRPDFESWLLENENSLKSEIGSWLPQELDLKDRQSLLDNLIVETISPIDEAIEYVPESNGVPTVEPSAEVPDEEGEEQTGRDPNAQTLLDRLLYKGVLPRYAFPTDVATFHVFDSERSTRFRPEFQFTPSQGLSVALSQYAPGKEVWVANKLWTSGAIYSPMKSERFKAWESRRFYYECSVCHYAKTEEDLRGGTRNMVMDCPACKNTGTFGPATYWLRPPGFAHPVWKEEGTSPDDQPARSYATRAKLSAPTPGEADKWISVDDRIRVHHTRQHLLVTNRGPKQEGYTYCVLCGLIEPTTISNGQVEAAHRKPYPDRQDPNCPGGRATKGLVLGTDFITDVLLVSLRVDDPLRLQPGLLATDVALRTISEALTKAACSLLELEPSELQAEYRPALTDAGREGKEAEIYVYDTLPGGAGFAKRVGELGLSVFQRALAFLEGCPDNCDRSCYRCLRSYKNKFEHDLIDRHLGASLLRYLINGSAPVIEPSRLERSTDLLFEDIQRQGISGAVVRRNGEISVRGLGTIVAPILVRNGAGTELVIALHGPLTPDYLSNESLRDLGEYSRTVRLLPVDELVVRRNLPKATTQILRVIG